MFSLQATVDRLDSTKAVLAVKADEKLRLQQQEITWPKEKLPPNIIQGDIVVLSVLKAEDATKTQEELARAMLDSLMAKKAENV